MRSITTVVALGALWASAAVCEAQDVVPPPAAWYRDPSFYAAGAGLRGYGAYPAGPRGYGGDYVGSPIEASAYGVASILRSTGAGYNQFTQGMINFEVARGAYIDNVLEWQKVYFARKELAEKYREEEIAEARAARQPYLEMRRREAATPPPRLAASDLDPNTGQINWPAVLQGPEYQDERRELEELMLLKAHTTPSTELAGKIRMAVSAMKAELVKHINEMTANQYVAARNFLDALGNEALYASR